MNDTWDFDAFNQVDSPFALFPEASVTTNPEHACDSERILGYVAARYDDDGNFECYETLPDEPMRVYGRDDDDAYEAARALIVNPEYERPYSLPIYQKFPF